MLTSPSQFNAQSQSIQAPEKTFSNTLYLELLSLCRTSNSLSFWQHIRSTIFLSPSLSVLEILKILSEDVRGFTRHLFILLSHSTALLMHLLSTLEERIQTQVFLSSLVHLWTYTSPRNMHFQLHDAWVLGPTTFPGLWEVFAPEPWFFWSGWTGLMTKTERTQGSLWWLYGAEQREYSAWSASPCQRISSNGEGERAPKK